MSKVSIQTNPITWGSDGLISANDKWYRLTNEKLATGSLSYITQIIKDQYDYYRITIPKDNITYSDYYNKDIRPELELDRQLDSDL